MQADSTLEQCRQDGATHAAYGWGPRDYSRWGLTSEQIAAYKEGWAEFDTARRSAGVSLGDREGTAAIGQSIGMAKPLGFHLAELSGV